MQTLCKLGSSAKVKAIGIKGNSHCQEVIARMNFSPDWLEQDIKQEQAGLGD